MSTENSIQVQAQRKHVGISAQKVRLVVNQVRGMRAEDALTTLKFMPQSAAGEVYKTVASALANAEQNEGLEREDMWISALRGPRPVQADSEAVCAHHGGARRAPVVESF